MATKRPAKSRRTPIQEASDENTDPERLRQLSYHENWAVRQTVWRNPSLPEDIWRKALLEGKPEAWANPMASFYVLTWTPSEDEWSTLEDAALLATESLWEEPERCSSEGKALLHAKVQEAWAASKLPYTMIKFLARRAEAKGNESPEHREVVRLLVLCVRTAPDLTDKDREALDLLEAWTTGGQDRRKETEALTSCEAVKGTVRFSLDPSYPTWNAIRELHKMVIADKQGQERKESSAEHQRRLTNLIRRERPLPPVVA